MFFLHVDKHKYWYKTRTVCVPQPNDYETGGKEVVRNYSSPGLTGTLASSVSYVQNEKRKRQQIRVS